MKERKLDAETKLLAALGMCEHLSDAQYWAYYAERARTAREAMQFMLNGKWCDGINRHVMEAAVIACTREEGFATEEFEAARGREEGQRMTLRPVSVEQARRLAAQTGGSLLAVIVVDVDGDQCAITTWGRTRADCRGLRRWSECEGDDVAGSMAAWAALQR